MRGRAARHARPPCRHRLTVAHVDLPQPLYLRQPLWRDLFLEAYGMALDGVSERRAVRLLVQEAEHDRVALETARDHFVALLAEDWEPTVERALHYLQAALAYGDGHHAWDDESPRRFVRWAMGAPR